MILMNDFTTLQTVTHLRQAKSSSFTFTQCFQVKELCPNFNAYLA